MSANQNSNEHDRMRELIGKIHDADMAYYQQDCPIMTDREYDQLVDELQALETETGLVLSNSPTQHVGGEILDELLTMRRLGNYSPQKALDKIESIALDQDAYLNSLGLSFSLRYPDLSDYLRSRQLSTWEIGYCSLYCMGYKGKDIGNILSSSRYYKINSAIRRKLGLDPKETNLDIYLRKLMS